MFMNYTKLFVTGAAAALVTLSGFAADAAKPAAKPAAWITVIQRWRTRHGNLTPST